MNPIQAAISKISNVARQKFGDNQGWVQNNRISTQPLRQAFATPTDTAYTISRAFTGNPLTRQQYHQATQPIKQAYTKLPRPIQKLGEGFYEGSTVGLSNLDVQPSNNITEKLAYGVGYGASILNPLNPMNKIALGLKGTSAIRGTQQLLGKGASRLIAKGGASKILGLGVKGASQGLPYTTAYGALNLATRKPEDAGVGVLADVGIDATLGAIPVMGGLMKMTKGKGGVVAKQAQQVAKKVSGQYEVITNPESLSKAKTQIANRLAKQIETQELTPLAKKADEIIGDYQMSKEMYDSAKLAVDADRRVLAKDGKIRAFTQPDVKKLSASSQIESIIQEGRKSIGKPAEKSVKSIKQSIKQFADNLYTQMVDRYHPISLASKKAKKQLEVKGAVLRPEHDPEVLVRRLTGAGSIADTQYRRELKPIIDKLDQFGISKDDMDVYLAHKRIAGFGDVGREIYGADPVKSQSIINAIEAKYGEPVKSVADELYLYQDKALKELADSGFLSPEAFQVIKSQNPNYAPLYRVMDEMDNYLGVPTRKTMQGTSPIEKIKGSDRQIISPVESIIANTFRNRAAIEKNRVAQSIIRLQEIAPELGFKKVDKSASDTITIWDKGRKEFWEVGEEIASTAKGLNEENMNTLLKIFTAPASLLRQGATGRNPEFMIPNIIRDQLDASITSKYGYIPFVDYLSGLKSMISNDEVFKRWERSGAKIDLGEMSGRKSIQASFDTVKKKRGLFSWLGGMLDTMGKYSEQPTRVGLFKKAYQKTGNELLSMMESRDATVDFARMGTKMKVANSVIPFLNVGVQGFDKLIRATKNNPSKVLALASFYGILPSVSSTLYNVMYHPQEFAEVPQYEKDANFVFIKGRNKNGTVDYFTIPKGNVIPLIANPTEHFISYMAETDSDSFSKFAVKFLSSALPIVGDGSTVKEVAIKTIGSNLPQLIKPATEALLNRSFYKYDANKEEAKEIVPYYLKDKPEYKQDYEFTPKMYKAIGAVINVSPLLIKNTMEGYLAGYAKIPAQIIQIMSDISDGKQTNPNDITLLRRFMKQTYDTGTPKQNIKLPVPPLLERISSTVEASDGSLNSVAEDSKNKEFTGSENLKRLDADIKKVESYVKKGLLSEDAGEIKKDSLMKSYGGTVEELEQYKKNELAKSALITQQEKIKELNAKTATTQFAQAKKNKDAFTLANSIYNNNKLTEEMKTDLLSKLPINKQDLEYYQVAKENNDIKQIWVNEEIAKMNTKGAKEVDIAKWLVAHRREVGGNAIVTAGILKQLVEDGVISSSTSRSISDIDQKTGKIKLKTKGKSKKAKIKKIKTPKLSAKLPKRKKIKIAKIKMNKFKSLQSPKFAKIKTRSSKNLT